MLLDKRYGSSPRVRRTRYILCALCSCRRFISACAENAGFTSIRIMASAVHLRVCGERRQSMRRSKKRCGSSPRVRRTPAGCAHLLWPDRFISACAENAATIPCMPPVSPVHLRVCGERNPRIQRRPVCTGSSPRVRRTPLVKTSLTGLIRFISACAENAQCLNGCGKTKTVHLRVCGERPKPLDFGSIDSGSSPRVRRTRVYV